MLFLLYCNKDDQEKLDMIQWTHFYLIFVCVCVVVVVVGGGGLD